MTRGEEEEEKEEAGAEAETVGDAVESNKCRISLSNSTHKCWGAVARSPISCCTWEVRRGAVVVVEEEFLHVSNWIVVKEGTSKGEMYLDHEVGW